MQASSWSRDHTLPDQGRANRFGHGSGMSPPPKIWVKGKCMSCSARAVVLTKKNIESAVGACSDRALLKSWYYKTLSMRILKARFRSDRRDVNRPQLDNGILLKATYVVPTNGAGALTV